MRRPKGALLPPLRGKRFRRGEVYGVIRSAVLDGVLAPGERLPSTRQAADDYGVSRGLLEEVFALNEELDEIRAERASGAAAETWKARLERARAPVDAKRADHESQLDKLSEQWDTAVDANKGADERRAVLTALRDRFLERNYINNLLGGIERELSA